MFWKIVGIAAAVLVGVPLLVAVVDGVFGAGGDGLGLWALIGVVALYFHQRRQMRLLRERLEAELAALRAAGGGAAAAPAADAAPAAAAEPQAAEDSAPPPLTTTAASAPAAAATALPGEAIEAAPPALPAAAEPAAVAEPDERTPAVTASAGASILAWFRGGNTIVRIAVLILFVGVAFLLRYAAEQDLLPIELRLAAVAAGAVALLGVGFRLRERRRGYGLTLQGAGVGVLYMTVYAAMRLYGLLPPAVALATMVAIAALAAVLALRQDALPLAVVGFVGGFAAPLLASTGSGDPALLFAYCLALNLAIAAIASRKAWKLLNLVGFGATTLVAAAWGFAAWQPELLWRVEPFLVAHLALYLYVTVQYSRRLAEQAPPAHGPALPYVDASLVFGVPLVAAGLQAALVRHVPYALAASAAVLSGVYLLLGRWLWRRFGERLRLLTEGLLALGAVFLALIAPFALDARWTAASWAVQGAGMVWVAVRQRRGWALAFGLVLQLLAALAFWGRPLDTDGALFVANARFTGVLLLAASAFVCARLLQRAAAATPAVLGPRALPALPWLQGLAIALALLHLLVGGDAELARAPWSAPDHRQSFVIWCVVLAVALETAHRPLAWAQLSWPARPLLVVAGGLSVIVEAGALLAGRGWASWWPGGLLAAAAVAAAALWLLRRLDEPGPPARRRLALEGPAAAWFGIAHGVLAPLALTDAFVADAAGWGAGAMIVLPTALAWAVLARLDAARWPADRDAGAWLAALALPWLALLVLWSAAVNLFGSGSMRPLPYLPLLNPVDLGHGLLLLFALRLQRSLARAAGWGERGQRARPAVAAASAAIGFWWLSSLLVRTLHHFAGTPTWIDGALGAGRVQTGLSILWTVIALATMFVATRRVDAARARTVWIAGAVLLGVVVLKLLLVDLSQTGTLERIVSFVGVGLLMLVVGYVAPLPPQRPRPAAESRP